MLLRTSAEETAPSVNVVLQLDLETLPQDTSSQDSTDAMLGEGFHNETNDRYGELLRDHPYLPRFPLSDVRATPNILPMGFQWSVCDLNDEGTCNEICSLFSVRTIHPHDLYNDSKEYLRWSLCPPSYFPDWHVGVRKAPCGKLVAFVSAVPTRIRVRGTVFPMADLHHLYVDLTARESIPQTMLFSEILRRVNSKGVWQQVYRWESFLPAPIAVTRLWERFLDLRRLRDLYFTTPRPGMKIKQITMSCTLPEFIKKPGIREMGPLDVPAVSVLLRNYLSRFVVAPEFSEADVNHWLLPRKDVLDSFVVETSDEITEFFSYTRLQSRHGGELLAVARLFYFATQTTSPVHWFIRDMVLTARYCHCDLFVTDKFKNIEIFLAELRFDRTVGKVQYNLNNYPMDVLQCSEVGLSLL